jgi:transcriptional regulator
MCKHYLTLSEDHRHYVPSEEHGNCVLCLAEDKGPMTQAEIASYMGLSKMRICQIEHQAVAKLKKRLKHLY